MLSLTLHNGGAATRLEHANQAVEIEYRHIAGAGFFRLHEPLSRFTVYVPIATGRAVACMVGGESVLLHPQRAGARLCRLGIEARLTVAVRRLDAAPLSA